MSGVTSIFSAGALVGGSAAVVSVLLTITATARLRKCTEELRDAAEVEPEGALARQALLAEHRRLTGRLVARQKAGGWPFVWPWVTLAVAAGLGAGYGSSFAEVITLNDVRWQDKFLHVFPGGWTDPMMFLPVLLFLGHGTAAYRCALIQRAEIERDFAESGIIRQWKPVRLVSIRDDNSTRQLFASMVPQGAAATLGFAVGTLIGGTRGDLLLVKIQLLTFVLGLFLGFLTWKVWRTLQSEVSAARNEPSQLPGRTHKAPGSWEIDNLDY